ncbi:hypothetical protein DPMN_005039 [Dreissena polymorpha]|uniref:Peptidase M1 membrane alanine aminopeptidase domain-containing protein n=1 Tax=Dreissena polymorpha TaxID=45954 RepID=A0A9D4RWG0_DREPO|nr:hypothetical protein DPMN_005039 [Dreissena polymorpha]
MIAIPDFAAGAMENWGLITYRETAMLFNPEVSSEANRQRVVTVVTHELAHQVEAMKHHMKTINIENIMLVLDKDQVYHARLRTDVSARLAER